MREPWQVCDCMHRCQLVKDTIWRVCFATCSTFSSGVKNLDHNGCEKISVITLSHISAVSIMLPRFPPRASGATFSTRAFSTRAFSAPPLHNKPFKFTHNRRLRECSIVIVHQTFHIRIQIMRFCHFFLQHSPFISLFPLSQLVVTVSL